MANTRMAKKRALVEDAPRHERRLAIVRSFFTPAVVDLAPQQLREAGLVGVSLEDIRKARIASPLLRGDKRPTKVGGQVHADTRRLAAPTSVPGVPVPNHSVAGVLVHGHAEGARAAAGAEQVSPDLLGHICLPRWLACCDRRRSTALVELLRNARLHRLAAGLHTRHQSWPVRPAARDGRADRRAPAWAAISIPWPRPQCQMR